MMDMAVSYRSGGRREVKTRIVLALRHRIILAFVLFLIGGLFFAILINNRHTVIMEKMRFIEEADDLVNNALEVRRYEKNYFLYGEKDNFELMLKYLTQAEERLQGISRDLHRSINTSRLKRCNEMLIGYRQAVVDYNQKNNQAGADQEEIRVLADRIRNIGRAFTENMLDMVRTERSHVNKLVDNQKRSVFYYVSAFFLLSSIVAYYLFFLIISPLSGIEKAARDIINGGLQEIPPIFGSTEIQSLVMVLNKMIRELDKKSEQLVQKEKMAALGTLTSGVAHELNNPLSNISSSTQILLEELGDSDVDFQKEFLSGIEEQVEKARDIVKSLLEFAREKEFLPVPTDLETLIHNTVKLVQGEIPPSVEIRIDIPSPISLEVDQRRMSQVLINLIFNGVQAMEEKGGILTIRAYYSPMKRKAVMEVSDTGVGIPAEHLAKIFDPFFSTKEEGSGTGLGLYVIYGIVQKHRGEITAYSEPGHGTRFKVTLPLRHLKEDHG